MAWSGAAPLRMTIPAMPHMAPPWAEAWPRG
jgi:hypothetical protein